MVRWSMITALSVAIASSSVVLASCGEQVPLAAVPTVTFANQTYVSAADFVVALDPEAPTQTSAATLSLLTAADGTATGTLTIEGEELELASQISRQMVLTGLLSGTFDPSTGAINLSGSLPFGDGDLPLSLSGTLPTPGSNGGTFTLELGSQSFTSTWTSAPPVLPPGPLPPSPPVPPTLPPGLPPGPPVLPPNGSADLQFSAVEPNTSLDTAPLSNPTVAGVLVEQDGNQVLTLTLTDVSNPTSLESRAISVSVIVSGTVTPGTYPLVPPSDEVTLPRGQVIADQVPLLSAPDTLRFAADGGTVTVESISEAGAVVTLEGALFKPEFSVFDNGQQGSFTLDGRISVDGLIQP